MKKIFLIIVCLICLSCSEDQIVDNSLGDESEKEKLFNVSGQLIDLDSNQELPNIIVELQGILAFKDTTNSSGNFLFSNVPIDNYSITINDSSYKSVDTILNLDHDTTFSIKLKTTVVSDYFPVKIGNWWEYQYNYKPNQNADAWWKGIVLWAITNKEKQDDQVIYTVKETVNGIVILGNPINNDLDTTHIIDSISFLNFTQHKDGYLEIGSNNYFGRHLSIKVNRYHISTKETLVFNSFYNSPYGADTNIIHDNYTAHKIWMKKDVGMTAWYIDNRSNSSPDGNLTLKNYYITNN